MDHRATAPAHFSLAIVNVLVKTRMPGMAFTFSFDDLIIAFFTSA